MAVRGARGQLLPFWHNYAIISDDAIVKEVLDLGMALGAGWHWTRKISTFRNSMVVPVPCKG